jgi:hypothetical protein
VMPDQSVTDEEIKTVIAFIGDETTKLDQPPVTASASGAAKATEPVASNQMAVAPAASDSMQGRMSSSDLNYILIGIIVFLTVVVIWLTKVIKTIIVSHKENVH